MGKRPTTKEEEIFIEHVKKLNPAMIGLSVLSPYLPVAQRLTELLRKNTSSLIVWGGIHPTLTPETSIHEADVLCVGEGEGAIVDLATHLKNGQDYTHIENLWVKKGSEIIKNPMRPLIQDLDSLPFYACNKDSFAFIDYEKISYDDPLLKRRNMMIQTSRGCPFVCSYCVNSIFRDKFKGLGAYLRRRSVGNVIDELKEKLSLSGTIEMINFSDEVFGSNDAWLKEFVLRYKNEIGLPFNVEYHPMMIKPTMLEKLVSAGIHTIKIGIQATSDDIRNKIFNRPGKNKDLITLAKKVDGYGVKMIYDYIMDNPYDTEETLTNGLLDIIRLPKPLFPNLYSMQYFPYYPFTKKVVQDGHIAESSVTSEALLEKNLKSWAFVPVLFPLTRKQALQNITWLYAWGYISKDTVKYGLSNRTLGANLCFHYMNIKGVVFGKIFGVGGFVWRHPRIQLFLEGLKYLFKGDIKTLIKKIKKKMRK